MSIDAASTWSFETRQGHARAVPDPTTGSRAGPPVTVRRPRVALRGLLSSRLWLAGHALGSYLAGPG